MAEIIIVDFKRKKRVKSVNKTIWNLYDYKVWLGRKSGDTKNIQKHKVRIKSMWNKYLEWFNNLMKIKWNLIQNPK